MDKLVNNLWIGALNTIGTLHFFYNYKNLQTLNPTFGLGCHPKTLISPRKIAYAQSQQILLKQGTNDTFIV